MDLVNLTLRWQRIILLALAPLTALVFWTKLPDTVELPKATVLWLGAPPPPRLAPAPAGYSAAVRVVVERAAEVPQGSFVWAMSAFVAAAALATVTSPTVMLSVVGEYTR